MANRYANPVIPSRLEAALIRLEEDLTENDAAGTISLPDVLVKTLERTRPKTGRYSTGRICGEAGTRLTCARSSEPESMLKEKRTHVTLVR